MSVELLHWEDTLEQYLRSSNEDDRVANFFLSIVLDTFNSFFREDYIRWIDVGTGPGTKVRRFATDMGRSVGPHRIHLNMLDPLYKNNQDLCSRLLDEVRLDVCSATILPMTLEQLVDRANLRTSEPFNFVSAIHFLYSTKYILPFKQLLDTACNGQTLILLVCESSDSDLHRIRTTLLKKNVNVTYSVLDEVVCLLQERRYSIRKYTIGEQKCNVDRDRLQSDDSYWLFPFLVARSTQDFLADERMRETVCRVAREYVSTLPSNTLNVPDTAIIAVPPIGNYE